MNRRTLDKAMSEAKNFLVHAGAVRAMMNEKEAFFVGSKHSGAVKRASMDLTRALADMRRPS